MNFDHVQLLLQFLPDTPIFSFKILSIFLFEISLCLIGAIYLLNY